MRTGPSASPSTAIWKNGRMRLRKTEDVRVWKNEGMRVWKNEGMRVWQNGCMESHFSSQQ